MSEGKVARLDVMVRVGQCVREEPWGWQMVRLNRLNAPRGEGKGELS